MPKAIEPHTITPAPRLERRGLLAGSTVALLAGAAFVTAARAAPVASAVTTAGDDAELLALCAEFHRVHAAVIAARGYDALQEAALDERLDVSGEIQRTPATTLAGHRAKASVAVVLRRENNGGDVCDSSDVDFAFAALLEIAGEPDAANSAAHGAAGPDAELITLCNRLVAIEAEEAVIFKTVAEEDDQDRALEPTTQEYRQIEDKLTELGNPTTHAGMRAMARASVAWAPRDLDGEITAGVAGLAEWLAFGIVESLAGRTAA
jgi:hypothetical protein